ncbi:YitT family protein [Streptococcus infantis]|uniref:YitT family protein n=1 Tax=Streptococcus infantis TaxID=68892 RepID=UPI0039C08AAE
MLRHIKSILTIIFGAAIYAFGLTYFVVPHHLFEGGATGITLITYYLFNIPISLMNLLINIPLFILAWKIFGSKTLYTSLLGTISLSIWLAIFEKIPLHFNLEGDLVIVALVAGVLLGLGLGIIFNAGGTTGGTDIVARILNKYTNISVGKLLFALDFLILMLILIIFQDLRLVTYTLLFDFIVSRVIDLIGEGGYAGKGFMIITQKPMEVADKINEELSRGVTFISGQGYYSQKDLKIIYCIVARNEMIKMKELIHTIDPKAFITITEAHEILGEGFTFVKEETS